MKENEKQKKYSSQEALARLRAIKKNGKTKKSKPYDDRSEVYLEEGSNLAVFERDVNKGLAKLRETRDIVDMQFKTGVLKDDNNKEYSWYSMAMHHLPKRSLRIESVCERLDHSETRVIDIEKALKSIEIHLKEFEKHVEQKAKKALEARNEAKKRGEELEKELLTDVKENKVKRRVRTRNKASSIKEPTTDKAIKSVKCAKKEK